MARIGFRLEARPTFRDVHGRFIRGSRQLLDDQRDEVRELGRLAVSYAQDEAPKRSGEFAAGIGFRSFVRGGNAVGFTLHLPQPIGNFIIQGTSPHPIVGNPFLAFYWAAIGEFVVVRSVSHPGTEPNDFLTRAIDRWEPDAQGALRRISTRYMATVTGG